jgi:diguanylate cyclase (GGDEF)-like protein
MHGHATNSPLPAARVLVIDDSPDVHRLLRHRLREEGLELTEAISGPGGIEAAHAVRPAVILLDLDLPGMNGIAVLRALKSSDATHDVPVIVLSREASIDTKVQAFDLGAADFVSKPFEFAELRARLRSALRTHELLRLLAQRAQVDGLTGLYNRSFFDDRWSQEHARNRRQGHPLSLVMLDIDHFKRINDTYGHRVGDDVLKWFGVHVSRMLREGDTIHRFGGEEFAIVLPHTDGPGALLAAQRVVEYLAASSFQDSLTVTASAGVACGRGEELEDMDLIAAADAALYRAKREGRNRAVLADGKAPEEARPLLH